MMDHGEKSMTEISVLAAACYESMPLIIFVYTSFIGISLYLQKNRHYSAGTDDPVMGPIAATSWS